MSRKLSIAFFVHTLRSDWNNGNAHFLRGLARALGRGPYQGMETMPPQGHQVTVFEPEENWSTTNLLSEAQGAAALQQFARVYPDLQVISYPLDRAALRRYLANQDIVVVHEWNSPELINHILSLRDELDFRVLFHDTHHRASSSPGQLQLLQVLRFDGVIVFGDALQAIYRREFNIERIWTLHEAADTSVFYPRQAATSQDVVWIGNWGDDERSREIRTYLVEPATKLLHRHFCIYGVRYPPEGLQSLSAAGITYGGYLPNLSAPDAYAASQVTLHIPRQQYASSMQGIPTIRVFEALASGIPLISAPWNDAEDLFAKGDFLPVRSSTEMTEALEHLLSHPAIAREQACHGLAAVRARHTCAHRARQFADICYEVLSS